MSQTSSSRAVEPRPVALLPAGSWSLGAGSTAAFTARNFGFKKVHGIVPLVRADVEVDQRGRVARVAVEADLTAIDTGNTKRDTDLAKPHLLDSKQYATLAFQAFDSAGEPGELRGRLSAKGHSIEVVLSYRVESVPVESVGAGSASSGRLLVTGSAHFDRADLGIKAPGFLIGRRIDVEIQAVFERVS